MAAPAHILELIEKKLQGLPLREEERLQLATWINPDANEDVVFGDELWEKDFHDYLQIRNDLEKEDQRLQRFVAAARFNDQTIMTQHAAISGIPAQRVYFLPRRWWAAAAVILFSIGVATAIMVSSSRKNSPSKIDVASVSDIAPGTNKAVLKVDGKEIDLASDKTGIAVGRFITYDDGEKISEAGKTLLLTTPNGGQYQLVLPDGTKAWLNAASGISFPSSFNGSRRQIKVTGEVYLEVAEDKSRPFFVDIDGKSTVQVLGTSFNINSYVNEGKITTTLVEGSVGIRMGDSAFNDSENNLILKPGQQAVVMVAADSGRSIKVNHKADLNQTLAWKNGLFSFNNADLHSAMRQLERWYDIQVRYEGKGASITVEGEMFRNVNLSDVLEFLKESGLKFRMEGKTLIVL